MGCIDSKQKEREKVERYDSSLTIAEGERVELSRFAGSLSKRSLDPSKPPNYQSYQAPLLPPAYRDNQPVALPSMSDYDILQRAEERTYKVPKVTYPRLDLTNKQLKM